MPELPEVEVVRQGLAPAVAGARVVAVDVRDPRALKRHQPVGARALSGGHGVTLTPEAGAQRAADFERRLSGARLESPLRRGKFLWIPIAAPAERFGVEKDARVDADAQVEADGRGKTGGQLALLTHLGMSGQLLLRAPEADDDRHVRIRLWLEHAQHGELRIDFADQRLFGSLALDPLVSQSTPGSTGGTDSTGDTNDNVIRAVPSQATHIAPDPLESTFDDATFLAALRRRGTAVKQALLDQTLISGVGNIYADEALWRARIHPQTPASRIGPRQAARLLAALRAVFAQALAEGGTSFDAQYVNVNGQAGYFAHSLNAYGRGGEPCHRCATLIKRIPFAGRSSHFCPQCQRRRR